MEETQVSFLIREDLTRLEATKPVSHSYEVCALELVPHNRSHHSEKAERCSWRAAPLTATREEAAQQQGPITDKTCQSLKRKDSGQAFCPCHFPVHLAV